MLTIAAPLALELAGVRKALRKADPDHITLAVIGVGQRRAQESCRQIAAANPDGIILMGFCGGAAPDLRPGDLHVADCFIDAEQTGRLRPDDGLRTQLLAAADRAGISAVSGPSVTVAAVAGPDAKAGWHQSTGAASVNMEDYWAATVAQAAGIPFASVRAVVDRRDQELPAYLTTGNPGLAAVAKATLARPAHGAELLTLARLSARARRNLTRCVLGAVDPLARRQPEPAQAR